MLVYVCSALLVLFFHWLGHCMDALYWRSIIFLLIICVYFKLHEYCPYVQLYTVQVSTRVRCTVYTAQYTYRLINDSCLVNCDENHLCIKTVRCRYSCWVRPKRLLCKKWKLWTWMPNKNYRMAFIPE